MVMQRQVEGSTITSLVPMHREPKMESLADISRQSRLPRTE